uniref:Uncharacterized protein n=1 Tax=Arundo donax TaxID=35708 RepID=A0A0A9G4C5_ARUDO
MTIVTDTDDLNDDATEQNQLMKRW